jgi:hypothetical protein
MPDPLDTTVALFLFNRPEPTQRVFAAIRDAQPPRLLVVADGPRVDHPDDAALCAAARAVIDAVDWPCLLETHFAERNMGCRSRVSTGLDWVFERSESAILLEDDCLPDASFFPFAEAMLDRYRDDERVQMIGATNYFPDPARDADYFFSRYFPIWGWASWSRAWANNDLNMRDWPAVRDSGALAGLYPEPGMAGYLTDVLDRVHRGEIDTWDLQWFYSCMVNHGLAVVPTVNLVSNIGYEGTRAPGENVGMPTSSLAADHLRHPRVMVPDFAYEGRLYRERLGGAQAAAVASGPLERATVALRRRLGRARPA